MFKNKKTQTITIAEFDEKLSKLRIPLSMVVTPVNLKEEKKKFFASDKYNPQFKYRVVKNNNKEIFKELLKVEEIVDVDPRISDFYIELVEDKKLANDLMNAVGNNELFTDLAMQKFRMPTDILFRNSCRVMRKNYRNYNVIDTSALKRESYVNYDDVKNIFRTMFDEFGLVDWAVNKSKNIKKNGVKTGIKSKEIFIDENIKKTTLEIKKTVVHELTHILRSYNGALSGVKALSKPNVNSYLDIEEGLAMCNEENLGYLKDSDLREKASVVYAIYIGRERTFRELYNILLGMYPKHKAFYLTYLSKRGLGDTSLPGIYPKSASYFRGFRKLRKKLRNDASLYSKLYAGKISLKQVKWVEEGLIKEAKIIPSRKSIELAFRKVGI